MRSLAKITGMGCILFALYAAKSQKLQQILSPNENATSETNYRITLAMLAIGLVLLLIGFFQKDKPQPVDFPFHPDRKKRIWAGLLVIIALIVWLVSSWWR